MKTKSTKYAVLFCCICIAALATVVLAMMFKAAQADYLRSSDCIADYVKIGIERSEITADSGDCALIAKR